VGGLGFGRLRGLRGSATDTARLLTQRGDVVGVLGALSNACPMRAVDVVVYTGT